MGGNRFTTRGIVAMVFSCLSGILGVSVIAWYGFAASPEGSPLGVTGDNEVTPTVVAATTGPTTEGETTTDGGDTGGGTRVS